MSSINFGRGTIEWQSRNPQEPLFKTNSDSLEVSDKMVSANHFMLHTYNRGLWYTQGPFSSGKDFCSKINIALSLCDDESYTYQFNPRNAITAKKVWNAVIDLIKEKSGSCSVPVDPKEVEISASFIDHVFRPLIPDSPMLKWSHEDESSLKRTIGVCGLVFEAPFRLLIVLGGHLLLNGYSLFSQDEKAAEYAAYYQFRLGINAYSPTQEIAQRIYRAL